MIEAYPLQWPTGYKRTLSRQASRFEKRKGGSMSPGAIRDAMLAELRRLGAKDVIVSTNIPVTNSGVFYAKFAQPADPGVAVYFKLDGEPYVFACDKWRTVTENVRAITLTVEAIRGMDRWGVSDMMKRIFTGFLALPESTTSARPWWEVIGVPSQESTETVMAAYREAAKFAHPDAAGGSHEKFTVLQEAIAAFKEERGL